MSEIAVRQGAPLSEKITYAKALADAGLLPAQYRQQPANVLFAMEYADALGLPTISAITSVHVIDGKPSASADLIAMLVRRAGHKLRVSGDSARAKAVIIRADDPDFPFESEWDEAKATRAGLWGKGNWAKYPAAMLRARAITEVARSAASEALFGVIYTPEELGAEVDEDGVPIITSASPRPHQAPARPLHVVAEQGPATPAEPAAPAEDPDVKAEADADWLDRVRGCASAEDARALYLEAKDAGQLTRPIEVGGETRQLHEWITVKGKGGALPGEQTPAETAGEEGAPDPTPAADQPAEAAATTQADTDPLARAEATVAAAGLLPEPVEGEVLPPAAKPAPEADPEDMCRLTAQRRAVLAELATIYGGNDARDAAIAQEYDLEVVQVATKRLRELMQREQQAAG